MDNLQPPPIAIVGMAGVFPGARDIRQYWDNIALGRSAIRPVSPERWRVAPEKILDPAGQPDKAFSLNAGLIERFDFNPTGFAVAPEPLTRLDPMHHLVLEAGRTAWQSCCTTAVDPLRVDVILAAIALPTDTASRLTRRIFSNAVETKLFAQASELSPLPSQHDILASGVIGFPAALLGAALGLGGTTFTLDAACASSLFAVKLACDALQAGRADAVLAGGVARPDTLYTQIGFTQLQALSRSGRCAPFDRSADGLVVGEGCGIVVLKRLDDALQQGDTIHALIRGAGVSNDMRGNLLAPDTEGQLRAMQMAYTATGWQPSDVDLIECHGAGTPVGDATEIRSLKALWGPEGWQPGQCAIGTVKSMIGHLLTAAGAAGLIKVLLGLRHATLPPSLNFKEPAPEYGLSDSPFRVPTRAMPWTRRNEGTPRRAAVSAFGFGGINAHLLVEEWLSAPEAPHTAAHRQNRNISDASLPSPDSIAIVGMETLFGRAENLRAFQEMVFRGDPAFEPVTAPRLKNCQGLLASYLHRPQALQGAFLKDFAVALTDFRIPPKEIPDLLPQHLLMLKVALGAMQDAGLALHQERPRMGCIVGMEFDLENTNFHLRWNTDHWVARWNAHYGLGLSPDQLREWAQALADTFAPPLTHTRTLGALGGVIASRIAREFRFGGPSFTVSDEAASGLKALAIAMRALQRREVDSMLVGAVDLPGDLRRLIRAHSRQAFAAGTSPACLDTRADGTLPGEGAAAVVLKRLADARRNGDRVYAVVRGLGAARRGSTFESDDLTEALKTALVNALDEAHVAPQAVGYMEAHGSAIPPEDQAEYRALEQVLGGGRKAPLALGTVKAALGHTGAAAGLTGLVKTALCLSQQIIPPLPRYQAPPDISAGEECFHVPIRPLFWPADRDDLPRRACLNTLTADGNAMSVVLEEFVSEDSSMTDSLLSAPAGIPDHGLFVLESPSVEQLKDRLTGLSDHLAESRRSGRPIGTAALEWLHRHGSNPQLPCALAISLADYRDVDRVHQDAREALDRHRPITFQGLSGCHFSPQPLGPNARPALVYPGSGNHYPGMGRQLSIQWPEIWRAANRSTDRFAAQARAAVLMPYRARWPESWRQEAQAAINADPVTAIYGQVLFGCLTTDLLHFLGVRPSAVIGYSLGETVGYFATGAWPDRGQMLARMENSDLFRTQLAGPCQAARGYLPIPDEVPVDWRAAVVNRPADVVRKFLKDAPAVRLLIINTPEECVIGGHGPAVADLIRRMDCEAFYLEGVVAVHWEAVQTVAEAYRELHRFPTTPPDGLVYYSCAAGRPIDLTSETAAESLLKQAIAGFDFPATIEQAYRDGTRLFLEVGPRGSCTRMIRSILNDRPHLALTLAPDPENEVAGLAKALGVLAAERLPVRLERFFPLDKAVTATLAESTLPQARTISISCGGMPLDPPRPPQGEQLIGQNTLSLPTTQPDQAPTATNPTPLPIDDETAADRLFFDQTSALLRGLNDQLAATGAAHQRFLDLTQDLGRQYAQTVDLHTRLMYQAQSEGLLPDGLPPPSLVSTHHDEALSPVLPEQVSPKPQVQPVAFDRAMCLEFAVGSVAKVLGPEFAPVDRFAARVRLPDEPLMLVDRILSVEGQKGVLGPGRLVTEHDVHPDAWYLDGGRAPVCIAVEAGQADLFLSSYLGIDLEVKGERTYRLLDATVTFHRGLPLPGEVIRYDIRIEKFIRQGATWLFFFQFDGTIDGQPLITMRNGCAGFFTEEEVRRSGGIILTAEDSRPLPGKVPDDWQPPVPMVREAYDEAGLEALRQGDLEACFGPAFKDLRLPANLRLPGGQMALIHRVLSLDPAGGRYGLGAIRAEADIHPNDWFLTCHFVDDMVMPGTLMYECCAHTLRILLLRMGWISDRLEVVYEPVIDRPAVLKCRGPVTPETRKVIYEVELSEIGFAPEPYVIADAHMVADGHRIVFFQGMTMKLSGMDRTTLEDFWRRRPPHRIDQTAGKAPDEPPAIVFSREQLIEFATGRPSQAFGPPYRPFDQERFIARLPGPPYAFIDAVTRTEPPAWVVAPDGWVETVYQPDPGDWYFRSNSGPFMPLCVLMEIALQACGFLAAYMGSALQSEKDLHFRNLDGEATLHANIRRQDTDPVRTRARLLQSSAAGDMLIQHYAFEVRQAEKIVYEGQTSFGFFTPEALANQAGLGKADHPPSIALPGETLLRLEDIAPLTPDDLAPRPRNAAAWPSKALRMIDTIEAFDPQAGPHGLGYIRGSKTVDPAEWFFKAHFYQDPVCPGSLGIESLIQLLQYAASVIWPAEIQTHTMALRAPTTHIWRYRGQILPSHRRVEVEAVITECGNRPHPTIKADGYLKCDGLYIYKMQNFGLGLLPRETPR